MKAKYFSKYFDRKKIKFRKSSLGVISILSSNEQSSRPIFCAVTAYHPTLLIKTLNT